MNQLHQKLEEIKQLYHYSVHMFYGEDSGADDFDIAPNDRSVRVYAIPVGVLGGARACWSAKSMDEFMEMDISEPPIVLVNPPIPKALRNTGRYVWGTDDALQTLTDEGYFTREGYRLDEK